MNRNRWLTSHTSPAAERYEQALRALCQNGIEQYEAGITGEAPSGLNSAVAETRAAVPLWRRILIDRRVIRQLDYWARTGQVSR